MSSNRKASQRYNPGSLDETDTETLKMGMVEELWEISTSFLQTDEILGDAHEKINTLEIDRDNMNSKIEETYKLSVEGDKVLAEKIDEVSGWIDTEGGKLEGMIKDEATVRLEKDNALAQTIDSVKTGLESDDAKLGSQITETNKTVTTLKETVASNKLELESTLSGAVSDIEGKLSVTNNTVANLDKSITSQITNLQSDYNGKFSSVNQTLSTQADKLGNVESKWGVQMNSNGKISGVSMNNNGATSDFSVVADRFTISDGGSTTIPPFEVVGGNTRIKSAFINSIQSDNWDGAGTGWAITRDGWARFNNVVVKGTVYADSGVFNNVTIENNCTVKGKIFATNLDEGTSAVRVGTAVNQPVNFPAYGRNRMVVVWGMQINGRTYHDVQVGSKAQLRIIANGSVLYSQDLSVTSYTNFQFNTLTGALSLPAGQACDVVAQLTLTHGGTFDQLSCTPMVAGAYIQ